MKRPEQRKAIEAAAQGLSPALFKPFRGLAFDLMSHQERWGLFLLKFELDRAQMAVSAAVGRLLGKVRRIDALAYATWSQLEQALVDAATSCDAIELLDLDEWLSNYTDVNQANARLRAWNIRREGYAAGVKVPLLCWLRSDSLRTLANDAPDLWSWRAGVYEFELDNEQESVADLPEMMIRPSETDNRSSSERRDRIREIMQHLVSYPADINPAMGISLWGELADLHKGLGEYEAALVVLREQLFPLVEKNLDERGIAQINGKVAEVLFLQGKLDEARQIILDAEIPIYEKLSDDVARAISLGVIASIFYKQGHLDKALHIIRDEQIPIFMEYGAAHLLVLAQTNAAIVLIARNQTGDIAQARRILDAALHQAQSLGMGNEPGKIAELIQRISTPGLVGQELLKKQLSILSATRSLAFSARAAMRMMPILAMQSKSEPATSQAQPSFWYWPQAQRRQYLLAVLRAYAGAVLIGGGCTIPQDVRREIWRATTNAAFDAEAVGAYAAVYAATSCIYEDTAAAAACIDVARFYDNATVQRFEQEQALDLAVVQKKSGVQLLALPLWQNGTPDDWVRSWQVLRNQIQELGFGFANWLDWYEDRINGAAINFPLLEKWINPVKDSNSNNGVDKAIINIAGSTITGNITVADNIKDSFNQTTNSPASAVATPTPTRSPAAATGMKTIKIFLASSSELRAERDNFELWLRQQNDHYQAKGIYFKIVRWENFLDAMSVTRKQDDYSAAVRDCDIFLSLFATKIGKYTEEEFTVAHEYFLKTGRPFIYTFFKDAKLDLSGLDRNALQSLWAFQEKLGQLGHFYTNYTNIEELKLRFSDQLTLLLQPGRLG